MAGFPTNGTRNPGVCKNRIDERNPGRLPAKEEPGPAHAGQESAPCSEEWWNRLSREMPRFKQHIAELAHIQECYAVTGDSDYVLKVVARDLKSLSDFLMDTLMRMPGVNSVHSSVCLDELKCTSALPLG